MRISDWSSDVCSSDLSPALYNKLSKEDQQALQGAAQAAADALRLYMDEQDKKGLAQLKSEGMQVNEIADTSIFKAAIKPAYQGYAKKFGQANIEEIKHGRESGRERVCQKV